MKILLIGGTDMTVEAGRALVRLGLPPCGVVTVERNFKIGYASTGVASARYADVAQWAQIQGIPVASGPDKLESFVADLVPDFGLVVGWYHMVPRRIRERFARGCAGLHASLLPELRGGAPLNWAILSGMKRSGVTLFELGDGIDDGPIYAQQAFDIGESATIGELVMASGKAAVALVERSLPRIADGTLKPVAQTGEESYGLQRAPEDGRIDWTSPARQIDRLVRAVSHPYPGAFTHFDGEKVLIWRSLVPLAAPRVLGAHGQIVRLPGISDPCVLTGQGILRLAEATDSAGVDMLARILSSTNRRFSVDR